jgi:uncharacterized protein with PIN domain
MIVVDSSALLAILFQEPEKQAFEDIIARAERCLICGTAALVSARL